MFGILTLVGFKIGEGWLGTLAGGQTVAFIVLSLSQIVQAFNMRSERSLFKIGPFSNSKLNLFALVSVGLVALVLFTPLRVLFELTILPWQLYLVALGLCFVPLVVMEIAKLIENAVKNRKAKN